MADSTQVQKFVRHVILASQRQEGKKEAKEALKEHLTKVRRIAGGKRLKKGELKTALKELESRLNIVIEKEGDLVEAAEREHRSSEDIKSRINELEGNVMQLGSRDQRTIEMLRNQIKGLEHELRITEMKRAEEVHISRARIDEIRATIAELKEKISKLVEVRMARAKRMAEIESRVKEEAREHREDIEHIEEELAKVKMLEEKDKQKPGMFEKIFAVFHRKPRKSIKPEEEELFKKEIPEIPKEMLMPKPIVRPRPVVKHEILFEEPKPKRTIPREEEPVELPPPPLPPLMSPPEKKGFFDKIKGVFKKKERL